MVVSNSRVVTDKLIPTQFLRVPARIFPSLKTEHFYVALHLPCTALQKSDRQQKVGKVRFSQKWGKKGRNYGKIEMKRAQNHRF